MIKVIKDLHVPNDGKDLHVPNDGKDKIFLIEMGKGSQKDTFTVIATNGSEAIDKVLNYEPYKTDLETKDPWTILKCKHIRFPGYTISVTPVIGVDVVSI